MDLVLTTAVVIGSYLFGSISIARIVSRLVAPGLDLENVHLTRVDGSQGARLQTVGATTASIKLGPRVGCAIGLLDLVKGVIPVLTLYLLYPDQYYHLISAVFVVIGHDWPVFHRFKGGAGISPTYGGFFVVDWIGTLVSSLTGMILGFFIVRDILVVYTSGLWFYLLWLIIFKGDWPHILYGVIMNVIFIISLIPELKAYIKKKRAGQIDMGNSMATFPMGRGMLKIMKFFGVEPRKPKG